MVKVFLLLPCWLLLIHGNHAASGLRRFNRFVPNAAQMANFYTRNTPEWYHDQAPEQLSQAQGDAFRASAPENELLKMEAPKSSILPQSHFKEFEFDPSRFPNRKIIFSRRSVFDIQGIDAMFGNEEWIVKFSINSLNTHRLEVRKYNSQYQYRFAMNNLHNDKNDELYANHILRVSESAEMEELKKQYNYMRDNLEYVEDNSGGIWVSQWHNMDGLEELLHKQMLYHPENESCDLAFDIQVFDAAQ